VSGDPVLPGYTFDGRGPAQRRLLEWLGSRVPDCELNSAVAQRSPAGPWAIKIHAPNRVPSCAELLQPESWVERVAVRPQHLYVRLTTERLCEWVVEGFAPGGPDPLTGSEGRGRSVLVRAVDVDALTAAGEPRPLRLFRETAVARAVAALLRSRGFEVTLELLPPGGAGRETYDEIWAAAPGAVTHTVVVGGGVPAPSEVERGDHVVHLPVGEVDVRHGPLRARNGGSVSADDVVAEVVRGLSAERRAALESTAGDKGGVNAYGEAVLALLLIATPRARRLQLDDAAVRREMETFGCLADAVDGGGARVAGGSSAAEPSSTADGVRRSAAKGGVEEALRDLAAELDLIATNVGRGVGDLDPALVARSLRALAERCEQLLQADSGADAAPLWTAVRSAVPATLGLAALGVTRSERPARSLQAS
jgi:hypothetical protein